ncbi:MAG TPA: S8 family serine peptidase [Patescibacteria group bacterium]|nr:S8 family serine peptidase [Patescibacteria group bacterium]
MSRNKKFVRILLLPLLANFLLWPGLAAQAAPLPQVYEIQLRSAGSAAALARLGQHVARRFSQSPDADFADIYTFTSSYSLQQLRSFLAGRYAYLEPAGQLAAAAVSVSDPGFAGNAQNIDKQWDLTKAGFDVAWEKTTGSQKNVVGIIDTGIDETHQDLRAGSFVPGFDFVHNQPIAAGTDSDDNGHGTLVSGVLGATVNNGIGIAGADWQVSLMPLKALDSDGKGDATAVAEAVVWAADHGAQFLNLSIGGIGFGHDTTLANAISYAFNKGVFIAAAAGNDTAAAGENLDQNPIFPICDDNNYNMVVGVTATDQNDLKPDFANYGRSCIDVAAPGKRILSTINYDPLTKKPAPDSYAYASGTSMAVPLVVGQAALIKAAYPFATNIQIRDRIIATADPIDDLNLSQCGGSSCRGLLGAGRINVPNSLKTAIAQSLDEGDLVKVSDQNNVIYEISGGQKRLVSPFVFNQRFNGQTPKSVASAQLAGFPEGAYVTPLDGTLVKLADDPTVYIIASGQKMPVSLSVFLQRQFSFANVNTLSYSEINSWVTGGLLVPLDGTLVKSSGGKTIYWVIGQVLHPVNAAFYQSRGLNIFPLLTVTAGELAGYSKGDPYLR